MNLDFYLAVIFSLTCANWQWPRWWDSDFNVMSTTFSTHHPRLRCERRKIDRWKILDNGTRRVKWGKINLSTPVQPLQLRSTLLKSTLTIIRVRILQLEPRMSTSTRQKDISPLENRDKNGRVRPMLKLRLKAKAVSKGIEIHLTFVMRYEAIDDELTAFGSSQSISSLRAAR